MNNLAFCHLFEERHSGREYLEGGQLESEQLELLKKAAHMAPSCYNEQPWRFVFAEREKHKMMYEAIFSSLVEFNQGWAKGVPLLVAIFSTKTFAKNGKPNRWGPYDTGAAAFSMMLMAHQMGLMAHQMGGFDEELLRKAVGADNSLVPMSVMAIGFEKESADPVPKERLPLTACFFEGEKPV